MTKLTDSGYIEKGYYGKINLTQNGIKAAESIYSNCIAIQSFLEEKLHIKKEHADMDAVGIVAHISEETAAKFADYILKNK